MSKGPGRLQRAIVGLLDGTLKGKIYRGGKLTTGELLEELIAHGLIPEDSPHKTAMFTVRRACRSLVDRGIIEGEYVINCDFPWTEIASWHLKPLKRAQ